MTELVLDGRIAIVTGSSSGIGQAVAEALAGAGAHVIAVARRANQLADVCRGIAERGGMATPVPVDLAKQGAAEKIVDSTLREHGRVDIVVNAAGMQRRKPALEVCADDWDAMFAINLRALFFLSTTAARVMSERKSGVILNITSLTSVIGIPHLSVHGALKGAVTQLTKALAVEWAPVGIRVNAIGPGRIRTPMTESVFDDPVAHERFLSLIPMGRAGMPSDIGSAAVFLASDAASYITGQTLYVDGGWLAAGGNAIQ